MKVTDEDVTIAYVWFSPLEHPVWEIHVVADPEYHSRWLTPGVLDRLWAIALDAGMTHVVAQNTSPVIRRIWKRLGAEVHDKISILKLKD